MPPQKAKRAAPAKAERGPRVDLLGRLVNSDASTETTVLPQVVLDLSEVGAARRAYALSRAYPGLPTIEIAIRLARDHGQRDARGRPFRCKRLRRLIGLYASFVHAGVEPAPETIFDD